MREVWKLYRIRPDPDFPNIEEVVVGFGSNLAEAVSDLQNNLNIKDEKPSLKRPTITGVCRWG